MSMFDYRPRYFKLHRDKSVTPVDFDISGNFGKSLFTIFAEEGGQNEKECPSWRFIGRTRIRVGGEFGFISTVFLPLGICNDGKPFETLVSIGDRDLIFKYSSWAIAEIGHWQAIQSVGKLRRAKKIRNPKLFKNKWIRG